jgi:energy-coupling factor transport system substrate-specific component
MRKSYIFLALILCLGVYCYIAPLQFRGGFLDPNVGLLNWGLITLTFFALTILAFFFEFETAATGAKQIVLVSMLGTISALSRLPFAALMNFQPCTFFIICSGYVFGPIAGFMVAALTALISNLFLGHGPWTVYQIFTWGLVGVSAGYLRRIPVRSDRARITLLVLFGIAWGFLYSVIINIWFWAAFIYPLTLKTYLLTLLNAVWWATSHAAANAFFLWLFGTKTIAIMERFKKRFFWNYELREVR